MTHMVEHRPMEQASDLPNWAVDSRGLAASVRCYSERAATRVAQALDLFDQFEAKTAPGQFGGRVMIAPIPEAEIMQRAREAAIVEHGRLNELGKSAVRDGRVDGLDIRVAARALRDLAKPLADLVPPPVDPDLIEVRKIAAEDSGASSPIFSDLVLRGDHDGHPIVKAALAALKRGREIERKDCGLGPRQEFTASQL